METSRLNITLPQDLVAELNQLIEPRKKSRFIAGALRDRLKQLKKERQEKILKRQRGQFFQIDKITSLLVIHPT